MIVVLANVFFMLALLYCMCSETFKENKDNAVVKEIRKRTSKIKRLSQALSKIQRLDRHATQHSFNPSMDAHLKEIELIAMAKEASIQEEETTMGGKKKKKKNRRNSRATVAQNRQGKKKAKRKSEFQQERSIRLHTLFEKRQNQEGATIGGANNNPLYRKDEGNTQMTMSSNAEYKSTSTSTLYVNKVPEVILGHDTPMSLVEPISEPSSLLGVIATPTLPTTHR